MGTEINKPGTHQSVESPESNDQPADGAAPVQAKESTSPEKPPQDYQKLYRQVSSDKGRVEAELKSLREQNEKLAKEAESARAERERVAQEARERELEEARNDPDKLDIFQQKEAARKAREEAERRLRETEADINEAREYKKQKLIDSTAEQYGIDASDLKELADTGVDLERAAKVLAKNRPKSESTEQPAEQAPEPEPEQLPDRQPGGGGGYTDTITAEQAEKMSMDEYAARRKKTLMGRR